MIWGKNRLKKITVFLLILILLSTITGCINKNNNYKKENSLEIILESFDQNDYNNTIEIKWFASAKDGDSILISLYFLSLNDTWEIIVENIDNTGIYYWNIEDLPEIDNSEIKIVASDGKYIAEDFSDRVNINPSRPDHKHSHPPSIELISPNKKYYNYSMDIIWNATDQDGDQIIISIYYYSSLRIREMIIENISNSGYYVWNITGFPIIKECQIMIYAYDGIHFSDDISDIFTIEPINKDKNNSFPPIIKLISPNKNYYKDSMNIIWNATDEDGDYLNISIYYYFNSNWEILAENIQNTNIYIWNFTGLPIICNCWIKINATDGKFFSENISSNFTIVPSSYNVRLVINIQTSINEVKWNHENTKFASCSREGYLHIWNGNTGESEVTIFYNNSGENNHIYSISWSPDDSKIVSGGFDKYVKIWDTKTGELIKNSIKYNGSISGVSWSPDGTKIAVAFGNDANCIRILNSTTFEEIFYKKADYIVKSIIWNSDGSMIAYSVYASNIGLYPAKIYILNTDDWSVNTILEDNPAETPEGWANTIFDIDWSSDDSKIVAGFNDNSIAYWDLTDNNNKRTISIHTSRVFTVSWNKNGNLILSGTEDGSIKIYDIFKDQVIKNYHNLNRDVKSLDWKNNDKEFISGYWYASYFESSIIIWHFDN